MENRVTVSDVNMDSYKMFLTVLWINVFLKMGYYILEMFYR